MSVYPQADYWPRSRRNFFSNIWTNGSTPLTNGASQAVFVIEGIDAYATWSNAGANYFSTKQGSTVTAFWGWIGTGSPSSQQWRGALNLEPGMSLQFNYVVPSGSALATVWGYIEPWLSPASSP
jgi:hypothetical protein